MTSVGVSVGLGGSVVTGTPTLQDTIAETEFQLIASNYSGSGDFLNEIKSPHSGANQSDYDFTLSGSATHNTNHFLMDGASHFSIGTNNSWIEDLHRDNGNDTYTFAFVVRTPDSAEFSVMGNVDFSLGNGVQFKARADGFQDITAQIFTGSTRTINEFTTLDAFSADTDHFIAYVVDGPSQTVTGYIGTSKEIDPFSSVATTAGTAYGPLRLGATTGTGVSAAEIMPNNSRIYAAIGINKACSESEVSSIRTFLNDALGTST